MRSYIPLNRNKQKELVACIEKSANLSGSAAACGVTRDAVYKAMERDPSFRQEIHDAREKAAYSIEREIWRRGIEGVDKPVFFRGEQVSNVTEYSDRLLLALAKANMPNRYSERQLQTIDHTVKIDGDAKSKLSELLGIS